MLILILLVGCQEDKPLDIIPEKSDFELLINAKNLDEYHSFSITFDKVKIYQEGSSAELFLDSSEIELTEIENLGFSLLKIPLDKGEYNKIILFVSQVNAYITDVKENINIHNITISDKFNIDNSKLLITFDLNGSSWKIVENINTKSNSELKPKGPGKKITIKEIDLPTTHIVKLSKGKAEPNDLTIKKNDVVVWENIGRTTHRVYAKQPYGYFRSEIIKPNEKYSFTFKEKGKFPYTSAAYAESLLANIIVE